MTGFLDSKRKSVSEYERLGTIMAETVFPEVGEDGNKSNSIMDRYLSWIVQTAGDPVSNLGPDYNFSLTIPQHGRLAR